jgi:hypothetical protein
VRKNLEDALAEQKFAFKELDLFKNFARTDDDFNLLLKGFKAFQLQQKFFDPRLSEPIMQLLYVSNKTDMALEMFMSKVWIRNLLNKILKFYYKLKLSMF